MSFTLRIHNDLKLSNFIFIIKIWHILVDEIDDFLDLKFILDFKTKKWRHYRKKFLLWVDIWKIHSQIMKWINQSWQSFSKHKCKSRYFWNYSDVLRRAFEENNEQIEDLINGQSISAVSIEKHTVNVLPVAKRKLIGFRNFDRMVSLSWDRAVDAKIASGNRFRNFYCEISQVIFNHEIQGKFITTSLH